MPLVRIKPKYQVTLPAAVRKQARLAVGDLLDASFEDGRVTLQPKAVVDRELAFALEDVKKGRVSRPFATAAAGIAFLHGRAKKPRPRAKTRRAATPRGKTMR